jgi:hypothetical protein
MNLVVKNGFLMEIRELGAIHLAMMELREHARPIVLQLIAYYIAENATRVYDEWLYSGQSPDEAGRNAYTLAVNRMLDRQRVVERSQLKDPAVDFSFEIDVIPYGNAVLGIYRTEQPRLAYLLKRKTWYQPFGFDNRVDRWEGVTEEQWMVRKRTWTLAFGRFTRPEDVGFRAQITPMTAIDFPTSEMILKAVPLFETRVSQIARNTLFHLYALDRPDSIVTQAINYQEWLETTEAGRERLAEVKADVAARLKRELTWADLAESTTVGVPGRK